jgi:hypothetical protein
MSGMETAASCYQKGVAKRRVFEMRAEDAAELTIPALFPDQSFSDAQQLETPYNSVGARGVNHLASKLVLSLIPPSAPFFRLTVDDKAAVQLDSDPELKMTVNEALSTIERRVAKEIEIRALRPQITYAIKLLIVTGNALIHLPDDGGIRVFSMKNYVVERDPMGNVCEIVLCETLSKYALPPEAKSLLGLDIEVEDEAREPGKEEYKLYSYIEREEDGKYHIHQEIEGRIIPESVGAYDPDQLPFLALRWNAISGEHYGRGLVEELLGDLASLEALTKAIVIGAAASSRVVGLVNPNSFTNPSDLNKAENGAFVLGNAQDVTFLQVQKGGDFRVAMETAATISRRVEASFLLNASVQRQAERVTAEEVRLLANELEAALGGVYATLSQELQLPMVRRLIEQLAKARKVPAIPKVLKNFIHPAIITGVEALGRTSDLERLRAWAAISGSVLGPQAIPQYVNPEIFIQTVATALGLDIKGLVKARAQIDAETQQAQAQGNAAMFAKGASGPAAKGMMDIVQNMLSQQQQSEGQQPQPPGPPMMNPGQ